MHSSRHCFAFDTMVVVADPTAVELRLVELYVGSDSNACMLKIHLTANVLICFAGNLSACVLL